MSDFQLSFPGKALKRKKRTGRGRGSGHGSTAGKGTKGQKSRSGGGTRLGFEGGQMPLFRRIAKRGFSNSRFKKAYTIVNLGDLNRYEDDGIVNRKSLVEKNLIKRKCKPIKLLAKGKLNKKLVVEVDRLSASAREEILKLGGQIIDKNKT